MDNVHFDSLFYNTTPTANSASLPQCVRTDPNLFKDDVDIRFSKSFNTCKVFRGINVTYLNSLNCLFDASLDSSDTLCHPRALARTPHRPSLFEHRLSQHVPSDLSSVYGCNHGSGSAEKSVFPTRTADFSY